mmetsp:Transcript_37572/g.118462  ORF Transcript_37572/g.118462 Transcript_37572/m.118462 type:complete len:369 (+) Transcript_37572:182-1288(+)
MSTTTANEGLKIPLFPKGATSAADNEGLSHWLIGFMTRLSIARLDRAFYLDITGDTDEDETKKDDPKTPRTPRKSKPSKADDDISDDDCLKAFAYLCQAVYNPDAPASMAFNLISPFYDDGEPRLRAARAMAALRAHYSSTGNGRLSQLWMRLINDRQASGETAEVYLARFQRTATRIATVPGENRPSQQLLTGLATSKLSPAYAPLIAAFHAGDMDTLTMAELTTRVRAFAIQQRAILDKGEGDGDMAAHGYSATGEEDFHPNNVRCKPSIDHSRLCHNCDRTGHLSRDCIIPKTTCAWCDKTGHLEKHCFTKQRYLKNNIKDPENKTKDIETKDTETKDNEDRDDEAHANFTYGAAARAGFMAVHM